MKLPFKLLAVAAFSLVMSVPGQDIQRYAYHVWGTVLDHDSNPMPRLMVCFVPAERPINGRIPCVKTGADGSFAMTVRDIPDKYNVCASTTESPFVLVDDPDPNHRVTCSKTMEFGSNDDCRKVDLQFKAQAAQP
jgi:hypothetical protein